MKKLVPSDALVLSLDVGFDKTGFAVCSANSNLPYSERLIDFGIFKTKQDEEYPDRLAELYGDLLGIKQRFPQIQTAVIELPFFLNGQQNANASKVAFAVGTIVLGLKLCGIREIIPYGQSQVKKAIVAGNCTKTEVKHAAIEIFGIENPRGIEDDAFDALAILYTYDIGTPPLHWSNLKKDPPVSRAPKMPKQRTPRRRMTQKKLALAL